MINIEIVFLSFIVLFGIAILVLAWLTTHEMLERSKSQLELFFISNKITSLKDKKEE